MWQIERNGFPMKIRKAVAADFPAVFALYQNATAAMSNVGIEQWDTFYPDEETIREDIDSGCAYLGILDREIVSVFTINQISDPEYADGNWQYPDASYAVVHRLCVHPLSWREGIGRQTMLAAEAIAQSMNLETVRLDAFSQNPAALALYRRLGYSQVGSVQFRKGEFFLFEKKLDTSR
jgi:ribosomal protein S18 acetylase RimI-like enzyme